MEQITTSLMFVGDQAGNAEEAINLYVSLFDGEIHGIQRHPEGGTEKGILQARFDLLGRSFTAMDSGGPHQFTFTPAVSLTVEFEDEERIESVYAALVEGGQELMPIGDYGFGRRFGWVNDRYGVSWQLMLV